MKNMGLRKRITALGMIVSLVIAGAGCSSKLYSDPDMTASSVTATFDPMSFNAIDAKFRDYTFSINE